MTIHDRPSMGLPAGLLASHRVALLHEERGVTIVEMTASGSAAEVSRGRAALLGRLLDDGARALEYGEDPVADALPGTWRRRGTGHWWVPDSVDVASLQAWLHLGNWLLWRPLDERLPSVSFGPALSTTLVDALTSVTDLALLSFHDDDPWFLASRER